ncbi:SRPBCC domain-containing protein [Lacisediminihabitans profunda]|uniref:SRPBCC domain-containing protein n=1 Tax=Lacisediminihabitans profunda TaxID=2594790 RepID=UPI00164F6A1D|nr:SRPBCC domain-containing protein [Lacisediminihabitans profunda]
MDTVTLRFERELEWSPVIVWDALVDPVLVGGWLGDARIDGRVGGRYDLSGEGFPAVTGLRGEITGFESPTELALSTDDRGALRFALRAVPGGPRGTSTALSLAVSLEIESAFAARIGQLWETRLDQLHELLRGHPARRAHLSRVPTSVDPDTRRA